MHAEHSVRVKRSIQDLGAQLVDGPTTWFPGLRKGNTASVGIHIAGLPLRKKVTVEFGEPARISSWAAVPLTWKASSAQTFFPVLTGKVSVSPLSRDETRLTVSGMYEPPLGKLGLELNEVLMHNIAKATVKELAEQIAKRLERTTRR